MLIDGQTQMGFDICSVACDTTCMNQKCEYKLYDNNTISTLNINKLLIMALQYNDFNS